MQEPRNVAVLIPRDRQRNMGAQSVLDPEFQNFVNLLGAVLFCLCVGVCVCVCLMVSQVLPKATWDRDLPLQCPKQLFSLPESEQ